MNFSWLLNGTMEAHHLAAVYLAVWILQGSYVAWIVWQMFRSRKTPKPANPLASTTRDRT